MSHTLMSHTYQLVVVDNTVSDPIRYNTVDYTCRHRVRIYD